MEAGEERTRVVLKLAKAEPVTGSLLAGDGPERSFSGWMELVAALQAALDEPAHPRHEPEAKLRGRTPTTFGSSWPPVTTQMKRRASRSRSASPPPGG